MDKLSSFAKSRLTGPTGAFQLPTITIAKQRSVEEGMPLSPSELGDESDRYNRDRL